MEGERVLPVNLERYAERSGVEGESNCSSGMVGERFSFKGGGTLYPRRLWSRSVGRQVEKDCGEGHEGEFWVGTTRVGVSKTIPSVFLSCGVVGGEVEVLEADRAGELLREGQAEEYVNECMLEYSGELGGI